MHAHLTAFSAMLHQRIKILFLRSSHCGTMEQTASWERWDIGSIPSLAQWVKNLALQQLQLKFQSLLRLQLQCQSSPGLITLYAAGWPKKEEKKNLFLKSCICLLILSSSFIIFSPPQKLPSIIKNLKTYNNEETNAFIFLK